MAGPSSDKDTSFEACWRSRFSRYAAKHEDDAGIAGWSSTGLAARFRFFTRNWHAGTPAGTWVDVGCGAGTYTRWLAANGASVVGIDYSLPSVIKARDRSDTEAAWLVGDARALPLATDSANGALCFGVTQAVLDSEDLVNELARILRNDGTLWIDGLNGWCLPHGFERLLRAMLGRPARVRYESPRHLRRLVESAGFTSVQLLWLPIVPSRLAGLQPILESPPVAWLLRAVPPLGLLCSHSMVVRATRSRK